MNFTQNDSLMEATNNQTGRDDFEELIFIFWVGYLFPTLYIIDYTQEIYGYE